MLAFKNIFIYDFVLIVFVVLLCLDNKVKVKRVAFLSTDSQLFSRRVILNKQIYSICDIKLSINLVSKMKKWLKLPGDLY